MRVPMSWLTTFIETKLSTQEIADILTIGGIEVEDIEQVGIFNDKIVLGEITEVVPIDHDQDTYLLTVDIGELIPIVAKSPGNFATKVGENVAVALPGSLLINASQEMFGVTEVTKSKRYNHKSYGVLCSEFELGIGANYQEAYHLSRVAKPGTPLKEFIPIPQECEADEVLIIAILANIPRCQAIIGVAKEVAALSDAKFYEELTAVNLHNMHKTLNPVITDENLCCRFSCAKLKNVEVKASPRWLQRRLVLAGMEPINNVVDASNYVMFEIGQPTHAYDLSALAGETLFVRYAKAKETLHGLTQTDEEQPLQLTPDIPVIADEKKVVAIAGIVGGKNTAITNDSRQVMIESANFDLITTRKTQTHYKIFTEAGSRFSRGANPSLTLYAIERLLAVLQETSPSVSVVGFGDVGVVKFTAREITLTTQMVCDMLGFDFTIREIAELLEKVGIDCVIATDHKSLLATIGVDREDLQGEHDLIEEIARVYGYDNLPSTMPLEPIPLHPHNTYYTIREKVRDTMVKFGMQEVISYSFTSKELEAKLYTESHEEPILSYVELANAVSPERNVMRRSLLPSLLLYLKENLRYQSSLYLFEIGPVFLPEIPSKYAILPTEQERLTCVMAGLVHKTTLTQPQPDKLSFYDVKAALVALLQHLHIDDVELITTVSAPFHPGQCADIMHSGKLIGRLGTIHPSVIDTFGITTDVFCLDIDIAQIAQCSNLHFTIKTPFKFPSIRLDLSLEVDEAITAYWVIDLMAKAAKDLWAFGEVKDVYQDETLKSLRKKSLMIHFELNAKSRTLTMPEAEAVREEILILLNDEIGAKLRQC